MSSVFINKLAVKFPETEVDNDQIESILGQIGDKPSRTKRMVLRSNGIKKRYYALDPVTGLPTMSNAQLAAAAVSKLFADGGDIAQLDCLVAATTVADQIAPGHGVMVHGELGNPPCEVVTTAGICACGVTALKYAYLGIKAGEHHTAAVTASENSSAFLRAERLQTVVDIDEETLAAQPEISFDRDFLRWMLSDGAGAALLSDTPNVSDLSLRIDWIEIRSYANEIEACMYGGAIKETEGANKGRLKSWAVGLDGAGAIAEYMTLKQDVKLLNDNIVPLTVERPLPAIIDKHQLSAEQFDYFVPHYSSDYFRTRLMQGLENTGFVIPYEKWFTSLYTRGNVGSASIFVVLHDLLTSERLQRGEKILCFVPESGRFTACYFQLTVV